MMNRACMDGWLEIDGNGRIRPDEPVTAAEMAHACGRCTVAWCLTIADAPRINCVEHRWSFNNTRRKTQFPGSGYSASHIPERYQGNSYYPPGLSLPARCCSERSCHRALLPQRGRGLWRLRVRHCWHVSELRQKRSRAPSIIIASELYSAFPRTPLPHQGIGFYPAVACRIPSLRQRQNLLQYEYCYIFLVIVRVYFCDYIQVFTLPSYQRAERLTATCDCTKRGTFLLGLRGYIR